MSGDAIPMNDIRFYDSVAPVLDADEYTLTVSQVLSASDGTFSQKTGATSIFAVVAPRFALAPSEVQSTFPPNNASGPYGQKLPHIVLSQRAVPWERLLGPDLPKPANPNVEAYPWLALLVFAEGELLPPGGTSPTSAMTNPTLTRTYPIALLRSPKETSILGPAVTASPEDEASCRAIDVPIDIFTKVTPRLAELPYLAHARQVNMDAKSSGSGLTDGWASVVVANRFPTVGEDAAGTRNIVHLVSLEGFADYLVDAPSWPSQINAVRMASLASWSFTAQPAGLDFAALMTKLVAGQAAGGDGLRLRLSPKGNPAPSGAAAQAEAALAQGFAPLQYDSRTGDHSFAFYHGPFVPHPLAPIAAGTAWPSSAAATIYDAGTGTFDHSYAAAWETGRLMALRDRAYGTAQQRARRALRKIVNLLRERGAADDSLTPGLVSRAFARWLGAEGHRHLKPGGPHEAPAQFHRERRPDAAHVLRALLDRDEVQAQLRAQIAAAEDGPIGDMIDWLAKLRLLEGVPFDCLVPDARMLPKESIRFFYVDGNSLDALCDGAQSIGVQSSRDAIQQRIVRDAMREAAIARAKQRRAKAMRNKTIATSQQGDPVAGMLLRSAAVSGWPGLEIKAYADMKGETEIAPLRIDHVGTDVLIALYGQVPVRIDVEEPKESLAFGTEDDWQVDIRSICGPAVGAQVATVTLTDAYLRGGGVLAVDAWQQYLAGLPQIAPDASVWGPAAFALQMVSLPEQMSFDDGGAT